MLGCSQADGQRMGILKLRVGILRSMVHCSSDISDNCEMCFVEQHEEHTRKVTEQEFSFHL